MPKNYISGRPTWSPKEGNLKNLCYEELGVLAGGMEASPSRGSNKNYVDSGKLSKEM
jgi:hypothetical protein